MAERRTMAEPPASVEWDFAELPEDALYTIYALLPAWSLRAAAASNSAWHRALMASGPAVLARAAWMHHWTEASAGASIQRADTAVCTGDGSWHPGGVALATTLQMCKGQDTGFRLCVEAAAPGDLLMGITLRRSDAATPVAAPAATFDGATSSPPPTTLEMGYHYMMGRRLDADGEIQISPPAGGGGGGEGGGMAPRSIFYGGRSRRCCFATPSAQSSGPTMDVGPDGRSPGILAKLRNLGERRGPIRTHLMPSTACRASLRLTRSFGPLGTQATGSSSGLWTGSYAQPTTRATRTCGGCASRRARCGCRRSRGLAAAPASAWRLRSRATE